ncbi:MAG: response regulator transcription factor [Candidatus Promineifilaceae bacterium]
MKRNTILVVDDDPEIVKLLRNYLENEGYAVITAYSGRTALQRIQSERPDCVLLDLMLPDEDGWTITRKVRADSRVRHTPIIMLTARVTDTDKIMGLELGADDYVTKPFNPREILARLRIQLRHAQKIVETPSNLFQIGALALDVGRHQVELNSQPIELTATEFSILQTFMTHPGYVFTRDELIEKALGYSFEGIGRTVDSHIKNLRHKIEPDPRKPSYILTIYGVGYRFAENIA